MKKFSIFFIVFILVWSQHTSAREVQFISQSPDAMVNLNYCWQPGNPYRPIFSLDGEWEYRINEKDHYQQVILPASCDYWGEITFRRSFVPDSSFTNHFFRLVCYGINYYCRIFINEKFIGSHAGGYTSFAYDIADGIIKLGQKNVIEIKVDTRLDSKKTVPQRFQPEGFRETGGIFRSVYLLAIPEFSIEDVEADYQFAHDLSQCDLQLKFNLKDRIDNNVYQEFKPRSFAPFYYSIELRTRDSDKPIVQQWNEIDVQNYQLTRAISIILKIKQPLLWSPETPHLYSLRIQLFQGRQIIDQFDQSLGMRHIEFQNGDIYLNGKRLILKGVNWIEDYQLGGALFDRDQLVNELDLVKQLHANAIRVLHHPAHPMVGALCDSLGLFLLQEIPLDWAPPQRFAAHIFRGLCQDYLSEMINRDKAHVSVFGWGIGGHFLSPDTVTQNFINRMNHSANIHSKRPVYLWSFLPSSTSENDLNTIAGISIFGLYKSQIQSQLSEWIQQNKRHINLVLSYGSPQRATSIDDNNRAIFEEYRVSQIVEAWQTITSFPEIDGYFISTLSDYHGNYPSMVHQNYADDNLRPFGLTDLKRKKRMVFEIVKSLYQEGKTRYNPSIDIKKESPAIFAIIGLATILIFLFTLNNRRYFRENLKRVFVHPHGFYVDIRDGRKIPASHTILMAIFISIGCGLVLASLFIFYKDKLFVDHLATILLIAENLKMKICYLSLNVKWAILFFTLFSLLLFILIALYFRFFALITRKRCSIGQCLITSFWIGANLIFLIPLGMVLFRVMQYPNMVVVTLILLLAIVIWFLFRVAKGMRVMYIWTINRAFIVLILSIIVLIGGILYYYQSHYAMIDYIKFYYQIYGTGMFTGLIN